MRADPNLSEALRIVVDKIDGAVRAGGYAGPPINMYLAGGLAVHYYSRTRYTHDIDASFSRRVLLPVKELATQFVGKNGEPSVLYFDNNYNPSFALMHPDYQETAREWRGFGNDQRMVKLYVLDPVDLAVSKVSRLSEQDREDILMLASLGLISAAAVRGRAAEAMDCYVGNKQPLLANIESVCNAIAAMGKGAKASNEVSPESPSMGV